MKIKVIQSFGGSGFDFRYGQIIDCPKKVGERLVATGVGEEADDKLPAEGSFNDESPKEEKEAVAPKKKTPEKAVAPKGEKAVTTASDTVHCQGETKQGNQCMRTPLDGSDFCAAHQPEE